MARLIQSGLKCLGADDEAVKYLVGHDLGVRAHYPDPDDLRLTAAVELMPPVRRPDSEFPPVSGRS